VWSVVRIHVITTMTFWRGKITPSLVVDFYFISRLVIQERNKTSRTFWTWQVFRPLRNLPINSAGSLLARTIIPYRTENWLTFLLKCLRITSQSIIHKKCICNLSTEPNFCFKVKLNKAYLTYVILYYVKE